MMFLADAGPEEMVLGEDAYQRKHGAQVDNGSFMFLFQGRHIPHALAEYCRVTSSPSPHYPTIPPQIDSGADKLNTFSLKSFAVGSAATPRIVRDFV
jgi:hypothetical protein